jgi:hypothetical protein
MMNHINSKTGVIISDEDYNKLSLSDKGNFTYCAYSATHRVDDDGNIIGDKGKPIEDESKSDDSFGTSAVIGYVTDNAVLGGLLGGSLLGGIVGDMLND